MLERPERPEETNLPAPGTAAPALDPIRVAWRWKWLILLGAAIGAGLGYMEWTKTPTVYVASARLQVTMPLPVSIDELELDAIARLSANRNKSDEALIISSSNVLKNAAKDAELGNFPEFAGWDEMAIVRSIQNGIKIEPASKDLQTTMINISYTSSNPKLSEAVVGGVISAYNTFLGADHKKTGEEIVNLVNKVREEMDSRYSRLSKEYAEFRNDAPLYWVGGEGKDPFAENLISILQEIGSIDVQLTKYKGKIEAAEEAMTAGRPLEGIYLMLSSEVGMTVPTSNKISNEKVSANRFELRAEDIRTNRLVELRMKEKKLLESGLGENHPTLLSIKRDIKSYEEMATKLEENAKILASEQPELPTPETFNIESPKSKIEAMINGLKEKIVSLQNQREQLDLFRLENEKKSRELQSYVNQNKVFLDQIKSTQDVIAGITSTLDKVRVVPDTVSRSMQVLDTFAPYPSRASMNRFLTLGAGAGGLICAALGYLLSFADRRYKGPEDVIRELGRPIWGQIPLMEVKGIEKKDSKIDPAIVVHHRSKSTTSESFRGVRTSLYFGNRSGDLKLIQVTSASPADGKSTLAANLAVSIAQSGRRVALVDCDFRRPRVDKIFGIENKVGLSTVVAGNAELSDVMVNSEVQNLTLIPSGSRPSNPAELLSSESFSQVLQLLREKFDYVIIDSPPVLAVSDPANIAARVDGTLLALRLRHNDRALSARALKMLSSINANVLGVVVIGVTGNGSTYGRGYGYGSYGNYGNYGYGSGYGYGYGYGYGAYGKNPYKSYYDIPDADEKKQRKISSKN